MTDRSGAPAAEPSLPPVVPPALTDEQIDDICAPGRAKRWHNDGRQYDRDTARLIETAIRARLAAESAPAPSTSEIAP